MKMLIMLVVLVCDYLAVSAPNRSAPPPVSAQCRIACTVSSVVEWSDEFFPEIEIGELSSKNKTAIGQASLMLFTNGDCVITADNSSAAELTLGEYTLQTEYRLLFHGFKIEQSGANPTKWCSFDTFLKDPVEIKHRPAEGAVMVILSVKASVDEIHNENTGRYTAVQTLTACWNS